VTSQAARGGCKTIKIGWFEKINTTAELGKAFQTFFEAARIEKKSSPIELSFEKFGFWEVSKEEGGRRISFLPCLIFLAIWGKH